MATTTAAAAAGAWTSSAFADRYWVNVTFNPDQNWSSAFNWSASSGGASGAGAPGAGDITFLTHNPFSAFSFNPVLDVNASVLALNVGRVGVGGGTPAMTQLTGNDFATSSFQRLGHIASSRGAYNHSAGTNTVGSILSIGYAAGSLGTYSLSGTGVLRVQNSGGEMRVGDEGTGVVNQSGGEVFVGTSSQGIPLILGYGVAGSGTYNQSGGTLTTLGGGTFIGYNQSSVNTNNAIGRFVQTGGTHNSHGLYVGWNPGSSGTYELSDAASLIAESVDVGRGGSGTFTQSGGTHVVQFGLSIGDSFAPVPATAIYNLSGGSLTTNQTEMGDASGGATLTAVFNQTGGTHTTQTLDVGQSISSNTTYNLSAGNLVVNSGTDVGRSAPGTFEHTGGTHTSKFLIVGAANTTTGSTGGQYNLSGAGTLIAEGESVSGRFTQGTGTTHNVTAGGLGVGDGGTYTMNGGTLTVAPLEAVGNFSGSGTFIQSAGTHTLSAPGGDALMIIGGLGSSSATEGSGTYSLSGAGSSFVVNGDVHIGGTDSFPGAPETRYGPPGTLNIASGSMNVSRALKIFDASGVLTPLSSAVNLSGGTLTVGSFEGTTKRLNFTGGTLNITGPDGLSMGTGEQLALLTLAPSMSLNVAALTVTGPGTLTLNGGALSYSDRVTLDGGTVNGSAPIANGAQLNGHGTIGGSGGFTNSGAVNIDTGTLAISNTGAIANSGSVILPGGARLQLTGGSLTNTGTITLTGGASVTGTATLNNNAGGVIAGSGTISAPLTIQAGGTLLVQLGTMNVMSPFGNAGAINLAGPASTLAGGAISNSGVVRGDGTVNNAFTNAAAGEIRAENGKTITINSMTVANAGRVSLQGGTAQFTLALTNAAAGVISGRGTLRASAGMANNGQVQLIGGISDVFGNITSTSGSKIILSANATGIFYNPITLNAGSEFRVGAGSTAVFFGNVTGGAAAFTGSGTKSFENGASALGAIATPGDTVVQLAATLSAGHLRENALRVDGLVTITPNGTSGGTSAVNELSIGASGRLDLKNNKLIVRGGDVGQLSGGQYGGLTGAIASAYDFGAWDGAGIATTMPDAGPGVGLTTLAIATADETFFAGGTFGGVSTGSGDVLIMYTYSGDANLDGTIDGGDYGVIDNFAQVPGASRYANGDFNYDGVIDGGDYGIIDNNIQAQGAPFPTSSALSLPLTAVPEPSAVVALAALFAGASLRRRRRQRS